jgi:hypothetical protein
VSSTLNTFARDAKHLGGTPGFTAVLHTWTRQKRRGTEAFWTERSEAQRAKARGAPESTGLPPTPARHHARRGP